MICTIMRNWWKAVVVISETYLGQTGSIGGLPGRSHKVGNLTSTSHVYERPDSMLCFLTDATIPCVHQNTFSSRKMTFNVVFMHSI